MSEPVKLVRVNDVHGSLAHFRREGARGATLCKLAVIGGTPSASARMCATCVRLAGKLLTPKQESPLEAEAALLIEAAKLPAPVKQFAFAEAIGRRWRFDFAWPDRRVALEIDGDLWNGRHTSGDGRQADMVRDAYATSIGWRVFRVDAEILRQGYAEKWVRLALGFGHATSVFCGADAASVATIFPDERTLAPKRWARKRAKAQARRSEARA